MLCCLFLCILILLLPNSRHCGGKGCRRSYHSSCLKDLYIPNWYCTECTKKKLALDAHSVSQGVELILDVREVQLLAEGTDQMISLGHSMYYGHVLLA